ncbi:MAG: hypothetical protein H6585_02190 [Flavobacteriales bacterium]|nr:hypothetical protein [Flavobacteriales bacterium]
MKVISRQTVLFLLIFLLTNFVFGQNNPDNLQWSATHKLTLDDFSIKTKSLETTSSFAQFSVDYQVSGFDFLTKNFNKKVHNYIIKTASWIDTTVNVNQSLLYQQTLFDICEIYTRQFRKALRENRKKIANGTAIAKELNDKIMTDFSKRRIDYDRETKFGTDMTKQKEWEAQIQKELLELNDFAYDN